eukprot:GHVR01008935.1.p1 GENE.GHVR01008935.1~~GHVR01008935.1.p1  ORF type:complete len:213 (+),score=35.17 GHVR01008935.1:427-1065(+)
MYLKGLILSKEFNKLTSFNNNNSNNNNNNNISIINDIDNILRIPSHSVCSNHSTCKHTLSTLHYTNIKSIIRPKCIYVDTSDSITELNSKQSFLCEPLYDNNLSQVFSEDTFIQTDSRDLVSNFKPYDGMLFVETNNNLVNKYNIIVTSYNHLSFERFTNAWIIVSVPVPTIQPTETRLIGDNTEGTAYGCKHDVLTLILDRQIQVLLISTT